MAGFETVCRYEGCRKRFTAQRTTAQHCSARCRKADSRSRAAVPVTKTNNPKIIEQAYEERVAIWRQEAADRRVKAANLRAALDIATEAFDRATLLAGDLEGIATCRDALLLMEEKHEARLDDRGRSRKRQAKIKDGTSDAARVVLCSSAQARR
jgi:hypothetical protein